MLQAGVVPGSLAHVVRVGCRAQVTERIRSIAQVRGCPKINSKILIYMDIIGLASPLLCISQSCIGTHLITKEEDP
ncbi:hypothetical protein BGP85_02700 [Pseudomonas putida]|nr:hypothetical protein BGP85_02700 [Pseudomonas putida]